MPSYNWSAFRSPNLWKIRQNQNMKQIIPLLAALCILTRLPSLFAQPPRDIPLSAISNGSQPDFSTLPAKSESANADANVNPGTTPSPTATSPAAETEADRLVQHAAKILPQYQTIDSKLRTRFDLLDHAMNGEGIYQQQGLGGELLIRLELKVAISDQLVNSLLQVADGKTLWTYQDQGDRPASLSQVDLPRVRAALERKDPWVQSNGAAALGLGGLPRLMKGLSSSFHYPEVSPGEVQGLKVWIVRGGWSPLRLVQMFPEQKEAIEKGESANLRNLPKQVPWAVELILGRDDYFPYRISYLRPPSGQEKKYGPRPLEDIIANATPIVTLEFFEVKLNTLIVGPQFVYPKSAIEPIDQTDTMLSSLGLLEVKAK